MRVIILISVLVYVILAAPTLDKITKFKSFKSKYGKKYKNNNEEAKRFAIYSAKLDYIQKSNALFAQKKIPYELAENDLSDLTPNEVINLKTGLNYNYRYQALKTTTTKKISTTKTTSTTKSNPQAVDWRLKNVITPVKNQGYCGSCYAFATNGAIEAHMNIKSITNPNLSEKNLVDCSVGFGNQGCNGGWMTNSFNYIIYNKGVNNASVYPYKAKFETCSYKNDSVAVTLSRYVEIRRGDEATLENVVRDIGPVAVAVDASRIFHQYKSGVLSSTACSNSSINHAVLVVGFNNTNNPPYWLIKNSWGSKWGDKGYIKIEKNKNACCVANYASYPIL